MKTLKVIIFSRFKSILLLTISIILSLIFLAIRMKITQSFFYIFLVWNLFLALIPYGISLYLKSLKKTPAPVFFLIFSIWILFLPNAPYLITDLLHLRISSSRLPWLDVLLVTSFAYNGLMLFFWSVLEMKLLLEGRLQRKYLNNFFPLLFFASAFGIYLGRILRFNSWEIISEPNALLTAVFNIFSKPTLHPEAWLFTFGFGSFLYLSFLIFKTHYSKPST